jgi:hypothetical protein
MKRSRPGVFLLAGIVGLLGLAPQAVWAQTPIPILSVTFNPPSVLPGQTSTGTVTLEAPATANQGVGLQGSADGRVTVAPTSVSVPAGARTATFTATVAAGASPGPVTVGAKQAAVETQGTLTITAIQVASVALTPATVRQGSTFTGSVTVEAAAGRDGVTVYLEAVPASRVTVPSTVSVARGATTATFTGTTVPGATAEPVTISAWRTGAGSVVKQAALAVTPIEVASLAFSPATVAPGNTSTGTVTLEAPADANSTVQLNVTQSLAGVSFPFTVTVPTGATTATFTVTTTSQAAPGTASVGAFRGAVSASKVATLTVPGAVSSLTLNAAQAMQGKSVTGTVVLDATVSGATGASVALRSSSSAVTVPASVTVATGSNTATFTATASASAAFGDVTISASRGSGSVAKQAKLTVWGPDVKSVTISSATIKPGDSFTITVTLEAPAGAGGARVAISSLPVMMDPPTATIAAGATTGTFTARARTAANPGGYRVRAIRHETENYATATQTGDIAGKYADLTITRR